MWSKLAVGAGIIGGGIFLAEFILRKTKSDKRPSVALNYGAKKCADGFTWTGNQLAKVSSFYTYIDGNELYNTGVDIIEPVGKMCVSPLYTVKGYFDQTRIYDHPYLIACGTITICGIGYYVITIYHAPISGFFSPVIDPVVASIITPVKNRLV